MIIYRENALYVKIKNKASQPSNFYMPAYSLDVGVNYFIELVVTNTVTYDRTSVYVTISVILGDIFALISDGSHISVSPNYPIVLSGNNSYDEGSRQLSYSWSCFQLSPIATSCSGFGNVRTTSRTLVLPKNFTRPSTEFLFLLTVYDTTRASVASIKVSTGSVGTLVPSLTISALEHDKYPLDLIINPNQDTILLSSVSYSSKLSLEWRCSTLGITLSKTNSSQSAGDDSVSFNYRLIPSTLGIDGIVRDKTYVFLVDSNTIVVSYMQICC